MNKLFIIIIILILIIYIRYYSKINIDTRINQVNLNNINYNILQERYPIYIQDKIVDINSVIDKTFKYHYVYKYTNNLFDDNIKMNLSKYCIFWNNSEENKDIFISNPINSEILTFNKIPKNRNYLTSYDKEKNIEAIKIILKPYNILILPYRWLFTCSTEIVNMFLFDRLNILISKYKNLIL